MNFETVDLRGGPFKIIETYVYYDGPRSFAMKSETTPDLYYFVNMVETGGDSETGLFVAVDRGRFHAVRSGATPFRDAFTNVSPNALSKVVWSWAPDSSKPTVVISELPFGWEDDSWLPRKGVRLQHPVTFSGT